MQIADSVANLTNTANFLAATVDQSVVKVAGFEGIAGFVFDIQEDDSVRLESLITDHYVESNVAINDHVAIRPESVSLRGYIGEIARGNSVSVSATDEDGRVRVDSGYIANVFETISNKLVNLPALFPELTSGTTQKNNDIQSFIDSTLKSVSGVEDLYNRFLGSAFNPNQTKAGKAFLFFYGLWKAKQIFTVDTPFTTFTNMIIERLEAFQGDTKTVADFSITFKKIRFAKTISVSTNEIRRAQQIIDFSEKGQTKGENVSEDNRSFIQKQFGGIL